MLLHCLLWGSCKAPNIDCFWQPLQAAQLAADAAIHQHYPCTGIQCVPCQHGGVLTAAGRFLQGQNHWLTRQDVRLQDAARPACASKPELAGASGRGHLQVPGMAVNAYCRQDGTAQRQHLLLQLNCSWPEDPAAGTTTQVPLRQRIRGSKLFEGGSAGMWQGMLLVQQRWQLPRRCISRCDWRVALLQSAGCRPAAGSYAMHAAAGGKC